MWRNISRPASAIAVVALLVLAGCGGGDQATSAGALAQVPPTTVASTTSTTVPATTTTAAPTCANVGFSSNSDDRASDIRATGLSCTEAEALVRKIGPQVSGDGGPSRVESDGFVCLRTSARAGDHGPPSAVFECTSGAKKVTFVRT
jgi:hypothetical protein